MFAVSDGKIEVTAAVLAPIRGRHRSTILLKTVGSLKCFLHGIDGRVRHWSDQVSLSKSHEAFAVLMADIHKSSLAVESGVGMGLDLYVGSLTRYFSGNWETIVQQAGKSLGVPTIVMRFHQPLEKITDPAEIRQVVEDWRAEMRARLPIEMPALDWNEGEGPYFTSKPDWDGYAALLLWAARHDHPESARSSVDLLNWKSDPAYKATFVDEIPQTRYPQLVLSPEYWLPIDGSVMFQAEDPARRLVWFGSSFALCSELDALNANTWNATAEEIARWKPLDPNSEDWQDRAKRAFVIIRELAQNSVDHRLPMKRDE